MLSLLTSSDCSSPLLSYKDNQVLWILFNRPQFLNAINKEMVEQFSDLFKQTCTDSETSCIILQGNHRAFSAGGDLQDLFNALKANQYPELIQSFKKMYRLINQIEKFSKPYLSFYQGFVMGGGLGLSRYGSHRIGGQDICLAMPEVSIGYFPDVGASYFLNQCPGFLGLYLGLTGSSLSGIDAYYSGLLTHYIDSKYHTQIQQEIIQDSCITFHSIENILSKYQTATSNIPRSFLEQHQEIINKLFNQPSLEDIIIALKEENSEFSQMCLKTLSTKSVLSLKVTFELFKRMQNQSLNVCLKYDFLLAQKFCQHSDFQDGIRASLIDKDYKPNWHYKRLDEVTPDIIEKYFTFDNELSLF